MGRAGLGARPRGWGCGEDLMHSWGLSPGGRLSPSNGRGTITVRNQIKGLNLTVGFGKDKHGKVDVINHFGLAFFGTKDIAVLALDSPVECGGGKAQGRLGFGKIRVFIYFRVYVL